MHPAAALADFFGAGEVARRLGSDSPCWLPWRSCAALASLALGDHDRAHELAAAELELARAFGAPRTLWVALHAAGLTSGDPRGEELDLPQVAVGGVWEHRVGVAMLLRKNAGHYANRISEPHRVQS